MSDAEQIHAKYVGETCNIAVGFIDVLDDGELLTGTPTVAEVSAPSPGLAFASAAVNTTAKTIDGISHAIGQAVVCSVSGGTAGARQIKITCSTDATPAQTRIKVIDLIVEAEPV